MRTAKIRSSVDIALVTPSFPIAPAQILACECLTGLKLGGPRQTVADLTKPCWLLPASKPECWTLTAR